jgi:hypothetical protein
LTNNAFGACRIEYYVEGIRKSMAHITLGKEKFSWRYFIYYLFESEEFQNGY